MKGARGIPIRGPRRLAVWLAVALLSLATPQRPGEAKDFPVPEGIRPISAKRVEVRGIPRFAEIEPGLARGGQPDEHGLRFLRERGYRTVLSFRRNSPDRRDAEQMGLRYIEIPLRAGPFSATPPTEEEVTRFLAAVSDSSLRPIFIHCRRGKDRTGAMAAIYRIEACGWTNEDAIREMRSFGFSGRYRKLQQYVRDYERSNSRASRAAD